jgi:hypothetical protein
MTNAVRSVKSIIAACFVFAAGPALAQNPPVIQGGQVTPGHISTWITNGIIGDGGVPGGPIFTGSTTVNDFACVGMSGTIIDCGLSATSTNNWPAQQNFNGGATAPTRPPGDNTTNVATTAFVGNAIGHATTITPADYGAKCDGTTDDTAGFVALALAASAAGVVDIEFPANATCVIWPTNASVIATPLLMNLVNVTGVMNFNGAKLHALYLGANTSNPIILNNSPGFTINNYNFLWDAGKPAPGALGVNHITITNGSHGIRLNNMQPNGGAIGIQFSRAAGSAVPRSYDLAFTEVATNVYYPISAQFDGDDVRGTVISINAGRPFFIYNVKDWDLTAIPTNQSSQGLVAVYATSAADTSVTTGIKLRVINTASTSCGSLDPYGIIWEQYAATNTSTQAGHIDANISYDIDQSNCTGGGGNYNSMVFMQSYAWTGGVGGHEILGDAGHTGNIVIRDNRIVGTLQSDLADLLTPANGWGNTAKVDVALRDTIAQNVAVPLNLGGNTLSHISVENLTAPSSVPTITGTVPGSVVLSNALFSGVSKQVSSPSGFSGVTPGNTIAAFLYRGGELVWFDNNDLNTMGMYTDASNFYIVNGTTKPTRLYCNSTNCWNWLSTGEYQPQTDNTFAIGDGSHRVSNVFANVVTPSTPIVVSGGGTGDSGTAWTTFVPALSCGTATFTVNSARFKTLGKTVWLSLDAAVSAIGTCTTGPINVAIPAAAQSGAGMAGREAAITGIPVGCSIAPSTSTALCVLANLGSLSNGSRLEISGVYESQ